MTTAWAGHYVVGVEDTFALGQIGEEEDRRAAFVASNDDIPLAIFRLDHGEHPLSGNSALGAGWRSPGYGLSSSAKNNALSFQPASVILEFASVL